MLRVPVSQNEPSTSYSLSFQKYFSSFISFWGCDGDLILIFINELENNRFNWNILKNIFFRTEILFDPCWAVSTGRWLTYFLINPKSVSLPASRDSSNNKIFRPRLRDSVHVVSVSWLLRSVIMFKFCGSCWNLFNYKQPWLTGVLQLSVVLYKLSAQVKIFLSNSHSDFNQRTSHAGLHLIISSSSSLPHTLIKIFLTQRLEDSYQISISKGHIRWFLVIKE